MSLLKTTTLAALTALALASPVFAADTPFPGSTVYLPPLATASNPNPAPTERVMRLPPEAGIVTTVIATNLLDTGPSWIVKGDKNWSLCAPRKTQVACSPIALVSSMRDIYIRAYVDVDNAFTIAYDVMPSTTRSAEELVAATAYFQARLKTRVAHFNRFTYTAPPKRGEYDSKQSPTKPLLTGGTGGTISPMRLGACSYGDDIAIECLADDGGVGGWGNGYYAWAYNWTPDDSWALATATEPPPPSSIPSYPDGPDNALTDPCNGPCQQVVIMGSRPEGCVYSLFGTVCTWKPPVVVVDEPPLPVNQPWFSQSTCNNIHALCTRGQVPADNERVESENPGDYESDIDACLKNQAIDNGVCAAEYALRKNYRTARACYERSAARAAQCMTTARGRQS